MGVKKKVKESTPRRIQWNMTELEAELVLESIDLALGYSFTTRVYKQLSDIHDRIKTALDGGSGHV